MILSGNEVNQNRLYYLKWIYQDQYATYPFINNLKLLSLSYFNIIFIFDKLIYKNLFRLVIAKYKAKHLIITNSKSSLFISNVSILQEYQTLKIEELSQDSIIRNLKNLVLMFMSKTNWILVISLFFIWFQYKTNCWIFIFDGLFIILK
jgi:hypothetical protein